MKALSIKQPWASLIVHGIKDVENRTWRTHYRGKIYIHSSGKGVPNFVFNQQQHEALSTIDTDNMNMLYSAIIGEVDIVDCVLNHNSIWAEKGVYNWVLANSKLYDEPILNVKGKLSFWEFKK